MAQGRKTAVTPDSTGLPTKKAGAIFKLWATTEIDTNKMGQI